MWYLEPKIHLEAAQFASLVRIPTLGAAAEMITPVERPAGDIVYQHQLPRRQRRHRRRIPVRLRSPALAVDFNRLGPGQVLQRERRLHGHFNLRIGRLDNIRKPSFVLTRRRRPAPGRSPLLRMATPFRMPPVDPSLQACHGVSAAPSAANERCHSAAQLVSADAAMVSPH